MNKLFIDSDIIIDLLAKRENYLDAAQLFAALQEKAVRAFTTPIVLANVDYIISKYASSAKSRKALKNLRKSIGVLSMDEGIVDKSLESSFSDFEDAMQYYAAEAQEMDFIVTRNKRDYRKGKITAVNARELIDLLSASEGSEA